MMMQTPMYMVSQIVMTKWMIKFKEQSKMKPYYQPKNNTHHNDL